jgi:hypothetical protein
MLSKLFDDVRREELPRWKIFFLCIIYIVCSWVVANFTFLWIDKSLGLHHVFYGPLSEEFFKIIFLFFIFNGEKINLRVAFTYSLAFASFEQLLAIWVSFNELAEHAIAMTEPWYYTVIGLVLGFSVTFFVRVIAHCIYTFFEFKVINLTQSYYAGLFVGFTLHLLANKFLLG